MIHDLSEKRDVPVTPRVIIEVVAGVIPQEPLPEFTKRYQVTSEEWDKYEGDSEQQAKLIAQMNGMAQGYAMLLMLQPDRFNWVRTDWLWL